MKRSSGPRATAELSKSLHHQLNGYALAAGAAGVSLLALAPAAEAKIVYTSAHIRLRAGQPPLPVDLNHDGIVDFYLLHSFSHFGSEHFLAACQFFLSYYGPFCFNTGSSNVIRASVGGKDFGAALRYGAKIQHGDRFITYGPEILGEVCCRSSSDTVWTGPWVNGGKGVKNRYLGLKFKMRGRFHFGWARITVTTASKDFTATLTGYAYETIPGKAIVAGKTKGPDDIESTRNLPNPASVTASTRKPATLGLLALGSPALSIWRRRQ